MNRYDWHFRTLPPPLQANAGQKVGFAQGAIFEHRANGYGSEDDDAIVRQFDLGGMAEFWQVVLSEPMTCEDLARSLAIHFMVIQHRPDATAEEKIMSGQAAIRAVDIAKAGLRAALRQARIDDEPWFIEIPEAQRINKRNVKSLPGFLPSGVVVVSPDPPSDGIDMSILKVKPRAAVQWLANMPKRRHLVPPSLMRYLSHASAKEAARGESSGRPKGTGYEAADQTIVDQMLHLVASGQQPSLTAAAKHIIGRDGKGALGPGSTESKTSRLVSRARKRSRGE